MENQMQMVNQRLSIVVVDVIWQKYLHLLTFFSRMLLSVTVLLVLFLYTETVPARGFVDVTTVAGTTRENAPAFGNPIWADFDNDGALDVFVINHGQDPSLFQNISGSSFLDVVSVSGITSVGDRHGAAWGDYDNDGYKDLFISMGGGAGNGGIKEFPDQLYRNLGGGIFTDIAALAGVTNDSGRGRSVNWVDFDNDGLLDIFLNNLKTPNLLLKNNGDGTFLDVAVSSGVVDDTGTRTSWSDYDKDGDMDFVTISDRDQLWKNNGDGTFTESALLAGISDDRFGASLAWGDYNNDGYNDLFIARGFNDTEGGLVESGKELGFSTTIPSSSVLLETGLDFASSGQLTFDLYFNSCRDPGNVFLGKDGSVPADMPFSIAPRDARNKPEFVPGTDEGIYIWNDTAGWHVRWSYDGNGNSPVFYGKITTVGTFSKVEPVNFNTRIQDLTDTLYQNNGDGTFTDVTAAAGVDRGGNNRGAVWGDYDNDGDLDLYVVSSGSFLGNGKNVLYRNRGNGTFRNVASNLGVQALVDGRGEGAAWGDYNNDGLLDLYITNGAQRSVISQAGTDACLLTGPHILFENTESPKQWLKITLVGTVSNRDGVGAKLSLHSKGTTQYREYNGGGGGSFFSQGSGPVHFGLGSDTVVDELTIEWPSGINQVLTDIPARQHITIEEANSSP